MINTDCWISSSFQANTANFLFCSCWLINNRLLSMWGSTELKQGLCFSIPLNFHNTHTMASNMWMSVGCKLGHAMQLGAVPCYSVSSFSELMSVEVLVRFRCDISWSWWQGERVRAGNRKPKTHHHTAISWQKQGLSLYVWLLKCGRFFSSFYAIFRKNLFRK